ncbi:MAG: carbon storage regulator CsrA [Tissierellia bacterium]|nr:carbon storage regulator CsrA [Tissierellia bacterium]
MLILTRKKGESIIINGTIEVKIMDVEEGKVSIGIEAPRDVDIFRKELYESIQEENVKAAKQHIDIHEVNQLLKRNK